MSEQRSGTTLAEAAAVLGGPAEVLAEDQISAFVADQLASLPLDGRSVCVLVPDATRTGPLPLLLDVIHRVLHGRVMSETHLANHLGPDLMAAAKRDPDTEVVQHAWWEPSSITSRLEHGTPGAVSSRGARRDPWDPDG